MNLHSLRKTAGFRDANVFDGAVKKSLGRFIGTSFVAIYSLILIDAHTEIYKYIYIMYRNKFN